ncbi:MAG: VOC family protein [Granulosicoccus sp.]
MTNAAWHLEYLFDLEIISLTVIDMHIKKLDHITIQTTQMDSMVDWYTEVLGLRNGDRPKFESPGAWLYAGDTVVVHLVEISGKPAVGSEQTLKLEHFAFTADGAREFEKRLKDLKQDYRRVAPKALDTVLFNIWDPDGNHIHVDFPADELLDDSMPESGKLMAG